MPIFLTARGVPLSTSAVSIHHFSATFAGPLLEGSNTHDSLWGDSSVTTTLAGLAGDDIYRIYSTSNRVVEGAAGIDTVKTWMSYQLPDNIENLTVTGSGRQASGNGLDNIISGGNGRQTLDGGPGDDVLIGEAGADVFALSAGNGSDRIVDFSGEDSVRLTGYGFSSFGSVAARLDQQGSDAVLDLGDGEVLAFSDTTVDEIRAEQFELELDISDMTQSFVEAFDRLSLQDGGRGTWDSNFWWGAEHGHEMEGQDNWYIDTDYGPTQSIDPFSVDDGVLTITAAATPQNLLSEVEGKPYTSGLLTTRDSFAQTYGYFEIRADMPEGQGLWPAFWLLPVDGRWPPELDVIEIFGQDPERLILSSHSAASGSHTIDRHIANVAPSDGFHSYGVLWGPEEIVWTYDGVAVAETATPADMHDPMYMVVNLGVGGVAGRPGAAANGAEMKVDYVRAYELDGKEIAKAGDDTILGSAASETLEGGGGNDLVRGFAGDDLLRGGAGDDSLRGDLGIDRYEGGIGSDTLIFPDARKVIEADLAEGVVKAAGVPEQAVSIENVVGGRVDDVLSGDGAANSFSGGPGDDFLAGLAGDDWLEGGAGEDVFSFANLDLPGGDGQDTIADFDHSADVLAFSDVIDADDDGAAELGDLLAAVAAISEPELDGSVTVSFDNGASVGFVGVGAAATLTDLVDDATSQIQVS